MKKTICHSGDPARIIRNNHQGGWKCWKRREQFPVPVKSIADWIPDNRGVYTRRGAVAYRDIGKEREQERKLFRYDENGLTGHICSAIK